MKFIFLAIASIFLALYLFLPESCRIDFNFLFKITSSCKQDIKMNLVRIVKSNKLLYEQSYESLRNFYYSSSYFEEEIKYNRLFNSSDIDFANNQNQYKKSEVKKIEGIVSETSINQNQKKFFNNIDDFSDWNRSHGGNHNTKFNYNNFINLNNISDLKLAWKFEAIKKENFNKDFKSIIQINPIYLNEKVIAVFPDYSVRALSPENGKEIWKIQNNFGPPTSKGMLGYFDKKTKGEFIYISFGKRLFKYNSKNGEIVKEFAIDKSVEVNTRVAPVIYEDYLIITNINSILLINKNTGKKIDKIDIHESKKNFLDGNIWGGVALDQKNGILFASTGNPSPATYGVKRPGKNERSNSVIAVDIKSRSVIWHFQEVAHDLWDFDIAAPPIIHNLKINNNFYEVVIVPTKVGNTLILERKTGKPIFDIFYKKAPISDIPGEHAEPYQIFIEKPEPFSKIEYSEKDYEYLDNSKKEEIKKKLFNSKYGWYETPSFNKDLIMFGLHGGAQWHGASLDPLNQYLYIPVNNVPWKIRPFFVSSEVSPKVSNDFVEAIKIYKNKCSSCHGNTRNGNFVKKGEKLNNFIPSLVGNLFRSQDYNSRIFSTTSLNYLHSDLNITDEEIKKLSEYFKWWDNELVKNNEMFVQGGYKAWSQFLTSDDLPGSNPPWGYIAKLDLVSGKILFKIPVGYKNINGKKERVGTTIFGGVASNKDGIIFATGTEDSLAYAIDGQTGKELWTYQMDATGSAPPLIYTYKNKQYVSFLSTGGSYHNYKGKNSALYTFTITK